MEKIQIVEEKALQDVRVFRLCEGDAVAAYSYEDAKAWYQNLTGLSDDDLYNEGEVEEFPPSYEVYESEDNFEMITVAEIIARYWDGEPFIAVTISGY